MSLYVGLSTKLKLITPAVIQQLDTCRKTPVIARHGVSYPTGDGELNNPSHGDGKAIRSSSLQVPFNWHSDKNQNNRLTLGKENLKYSKNKLFHSRIKENKSIKSQRRKTHTEERSHYKTSWKKLKEKQNKEGTCFIFSFVYHLIKQNSVGFDDLFTR